MSVQWEPELNRDVHQALMAEVGGNQRVERHGRVTVAKVVAILVALAAVAALQWWAWR